MCALLPTSPRVGIPGVDEMLPAAAANEVPLIVHHVPGNCPALTPECPDLIDLAEKAGHEVAREV